jgi:MYXO-CTERM domain-containing protein
MVEVTREIATSPVEGFLTAAPAPAGVPRKPLLALVALLMLAFRSRRTIAALLVAWLAMFAFEAGVHSVHHLGDQNEEARCVVASGSSNLSGAVGEPVTLVATAAPGGPAVPFEPAALPGRFIRPDQGRAPPLLA